MKHVLILFFFITTFVSCNAQKIEQITLENLKVNAIGKEVQFIDVRTPEEYANGHIDDAININISNVDIFKTEVLKLDTMQPVYLYCYKGGRSNKASKILKELGFQTIYDFKGGWKAWSNQ